MGNSKGSHCFYVPGLSPGASAILEGSFEVLAMARGILFTERIPGFCSFVLPKQLPKSLQAPRQTHVVSAECVKLQARKRLKRNPMRNIKSLQHAKLSAKVGCNFYINIGSIVRCIFTEMWWTRNHCKKQ